MSSKNLSFVIPNFCDSKNIRQSDKETKGDEGSDAAVGDEDDVVGDVDDVVGDDDVVRDDDDAVVRDVDVDDDDDDDDDAVVRDDDDDAVVRDDDDMVGDERSSIRMKLCFAS